MGFAPPVFVELHGRRRCPDPLLGFGGRWSWEPRLPSRFLQDDLEILRRFGSAEFGIEGISAAR